jgi:hypothetical protein
MGGHDVPCPKLSAWLAIPYKTNYFGNRDNFPSPGVR